MTDERIRRIRSLVDTEFVERDLDSLERELTELREALRRIAQPPYQWDSPESRDTEEVRYRIRLAAAALSHYDGVTG